jgi:hypothetical protein
VVDVMLSNPVLTVRLVRERLSETRPITHQGALNLIRKLEDHGWLKEFGAFGRGGRTYWTAPDVLEVIEAAFVNPPSRPAEETHFQR